MIVKRGGVPEPPHYNKLNAGRGLKRMVSPALKFWKRARAVESDSFENCYIRKGIGGSNPPASAFALRSLGEGGLRWATAEKSARQ